MKKLRNNKHFITFVCLIVGSALLCSAAVANIGNAGGYEAYKDGLLGLFSLDNYSATLKGTVLFDGEVVDEVRAHRLLLLRKAVLLLPKLDTLDQE